MTHTTLFFAQIMKIVAKTAIRASVFFGLFCLILQVGCLPATRKEADPVVQPPASNPQSTLNQAAVTQPAALPVAVGCKAEEVLVPEPDSEGLRACCTWPLKGGRACGNPCWGTGTMAAVKEIKTSGKACGIENSTAAAASSSNGSQPASAPPRVGTPCEENYYDTSKMSSSDYCMKCKAGDFESGRNWCAANNNGLGTNWVGNSAAASAIIGGITGTLAAKPQQKEAAPNCVKFHYVYKGIKSDCNFWIGTPFSALGVEHKIDGCRAAIQGSAANHSCNCWAGEKYVAASREACMAAGDKLL